ncbi:MAG: branched chain amino acid aminotransferase [Phycisphaerales bacterium]
MTGVRIGMWSGPRNISTALMRSWESRADCFVSDEPLYAHYLKVTGADHPARDEIIQNHEWDWQLVTRALTGPIPRGKSVWYQKHMNHHLTPDVGRKWVLELHNVFLIREPAEMITSFIKVIPDPSPTDLGLPQQVELWEWIRRKTGRAPLVIDARDVLENPRGMLTVLCEHVGVPFDEAMLTWKPGPRDTDGVWAPHWYQNVYRSTGFEPYRPKNEPVPARLAGVLEECQRLYDFLAAYRLRLPA